MVIDDEKRELFDLVRMKFGAPIRKVELTDDQLCAALKLATRDYSTMIQMFIIESNWAQM